MSTEIMKTTENAVTATTSSVGRGFENVDMSNISMPRAKLLQSNSPEVSDRDYEFRAGDIINTVIMEKLPDKFIPLSIWDSNILFVPRDDAKKASVKELLNLSDDDVNNSSVICRAIDGECGDKYGNCRLCGMNKFKGAEKPICTATINVLALPYDESGIGMPVVLQFSSTSYKHGKKFRDTAFYSSMGRDLFSRIYKLEALKKSTGGNNWFEMTVKPAGFVPDELTGQVEGMYASFAGRKIVVEDEETSEINTSGGLDY